MPDFVISIPGRNVGARRVARKAADVFNSVTIQGDAPDYPQLLPNGSGEALVRPSSANGGSLITNGSFETNTSGMGHNHNADGWARGADANYVQGGQGGKPNAHTGSWFAELDTVGEYVDQTNDDPVIALVPGHSYEFGLFGLPEPGINFLEPPTVQVFFQWRSGGADMSGTGTSFTKTITIDEGAYQQFYWTLPCPAGATGYRTTITLESGVTGTDTGKGVAIDDVYLVDVDSLKWAYWDIRQNGTAALTTANWQAHDAFDGRNCLYFNGTAANVDGEDLHIRCTPSYMANVTGGETYRFSIRRKSIDSATAFPLLQFQVQFHRSDGSITGAQFLPGFIYRENIASSTDADWTEYHYDVAAPGDATQVESWLALRGSGEGFLDALSLRCYTVDPAFSDEDPTNTTYLPAGNLLVTFRADIEFSAGVNAAVNGSISKYGLREKLLSAPGVTTITDARTVAQGFLLANATADNSPDIDVYDDARAWFPGAAVALAGPGAALYSTELLPLVRLNGSIGEDGKMTQKLEIGKTKPTDEELIAAIIKTTTETSVATSSGAPSSNISGNTGFVQQPGTAGTSAFQGIWAIGTTYAQGAIVGRPTGIYVSNVDYNVGNDPLTDTVNWTCYVPATKGIDDGSV